MEAVWSPVYEGIMMQSNAIYCGFCQGQCPLGVEKTAECRVIMGYECPYFCDPANQELALS